MDFDALRKLNREEAFSAFDNVRAVDIKNEKVCKLSDVKAEFLTQSSHLIVANDIIEAAATTPDTTRRYISGFSGEEMSTKNINGKRMRCLSLCGVKKMAKVAKLYRYKEYIEYFALDIEEKEPLLYAKFRKQIAKKEVDGLYNVAAMGRWLTGKRTKYADPMKLEDIIELFKADADAKKLNFLIEYAKISS